MGRLTRGFLTGLWKLVEKGDNKRMSGMRIPNGIEIEKGFSYFDDEDEMHKLDIYYPKGTNGLLPTIALIHGGGWMYGDRNLNRFYCAHLALHGFTVVTMSYRLLPKTDLRGQVDDIFNSLHWLEENGSDHHCDMKKLFITGDSAGGYFTGLVSCIQKDKDLQKLYNVKPIDTDPLAYAPTHGVFNLKTMMNKGIRSELHRLMFNKEYNSEDLINYSSFYETAKNINNLPSFILLTSEPDSLHKQTLELAEYLKSRNANYKLIYWEKKQGKKLSHVFNVAYPEWPQSIETNDEICDFFKSHLG